MEEIGCRKISKGIATAKALFSKEPISFFGGVDPDTGVIIEKGHQLEGKSIAGKALVFPNGKGSTVGSYTLFRLSKNSMAPAAIVNKHSEPIVAVGAIISGIPMVDNPEKDIWALAADGDTLTVDGSKGKILIGD